MYKWQLTQRKFTLKYVSLSVSKFLLSMTTYLYAVFVALARLAKEQVLCEEPTVNKEKPLKFQEGMRMPTISNKEV
jgi:hypothetical protein